jgi:hypothetical protein
MPFSKLKAYLSKMAERTIPRLRRRIAPLARHLTSPRAKPRIISSAQAMREIDRNLL